MSLRFFKRVRLLPGVTLNLSKTGASVSLGGRGLRHTIGTNGSRTTVGLPGTGLSYSFTGKKKANGEAAGSPAKPRERAAASQRPGQDEATQAFLQAVISYQAGDPARALQRLRDSGPSADADWLCGIIHLQDAAWSKAQAAFAKALSRSHDLGRIITGHQIDISPEWPLTEELSLSIIPEPVTTRLILAETCQELGQHRLALTHLAQCLEEAPGDPAVAVAFAEVALEAAADSALYRQVEKGLLAARQKGPLFWIVALMLGRLRNQLGRHDAAILDFMAGQQAEGLAQDDLHLLQYEMALTFAQTGDRQRCRQELSAIYARDPGFADVAERLGARREVPK